MGRLVWGCPPLPRTNLLGHPPGWQHEPRTSFTIICWLWWHFCRVHFLPSPYSVQRNKSTNVSLNISHETIDSLLDTFEKKHTQWHRCSYQVFVHQGLTSSNLYNQLLLFMSQQRSYPNNQFSTKTKPNKKGRSNRIQIILPRSGANITTIGVSSACRLKQSQNRTFQSTNPTTRKP